MTAWTARMIAPNSEFSGAPLLRTEFELDEGHGAVRDASLVLSALGACEAWINGSALSPDLLTPGWSSYEWRVRYARYDVTAAMAQTTVLGIALGNGWYRGRLGWDGGRAFYGSELAAFAELRIQFADGHVQLVASDESWCAGPSATTANDLYDGQDIDARLRDGAWLKPGFASGNWGGVHALDFDLAKLEPYVGPPIRRQQEIAPVKVWTSPAGSTLVDFGQNLVGWVRVRVQGVPGDAVTLRHAEVLEHDELGVRPLRGARATDSFTLSGEVDEFEPTFTFHGFRYAEVSGWPGGIEAIGDGSLTAVVIGSELKRIGYLETSDGLLNQLHQNAVWGTRGNFVDVPTDCPQRDERLGWTGDIAAFAPSAAYLFDVDDFLRDWLIDVDLEQSHADGIVPLVVPDVIKYFDLPEGFPEAESTAIWSDAAVWVPWALSQAYGGVRVLQAQFGSMSAHMRRVRSLLSPSGLWDSGMQLGDWLDPDAPPEQPQLAKADGYVVATICAYRSATMVADAARALEDGEAASEFDELAARIRSGFTEHYLDGGLITSDCVTVYALAVIAGIIDGDDLAFAGRRLVELLEENGYHIATGFAGTPFVTDALTLTGHLDAAYRLLLQTECPSWLYPVTMGATTIWERWDSMLPDGTINPGQMTSFNHYALGAVVDWMHRTIGGIAPLTPGYETVLIAPQPGGGLSWARASLETPHGQVAVNWRVEDELFTLEASIPDGCSALVRMPDGSERKVGGGVHRIASPATP